MRYGVDFSRPHDMLIAKVGPAPGRGAGHPENTTPRAREGLRGEVGPALRAEAFFFVASHAGGPTTTFTCINQGRV